MKKLMIIIIVALTFTTLQASESVLWIKKNELVKIHIEDSVWSFDTGVPPIIDKYSYVLLRNYEILSVYSIGYNIYFCVKIRTKN